MTAMEQMDAIVENALQDILAATDPGVISARAQQAYDELDNVPVSTDEEDAYLTECKDRIAQAVFDVGAGQRQAALNALCDTSKKLSEASKKMDKAAADTILAKVSNVGNTVAATVTSIAATVKALGDELEKVGNGESEIDGDTLSQKINDTLDRITELRSL